MSLTFSNEMFLVWETLVLTLQTAYSACSTHTFSFFKKFFFSKAEIQSLYLTPISQSICTVASSSHQSISRLPHYQMVRLTPAQIECLTPCVARTSSQCSRVLGISSSGSGSGRAPFLGLATSTGSGPRCDWNSTTWSCFLSARVWWVSCQVENE